MNLKKLSEKVRIYGDTDYRGKCKHEDFEVASFMAWVRYNHPQYALLITHIKNEGKRSWGQARRDKGIGMVKGYADIICIGSPCLVLEMKRKDHTLSNLGSEQALHLNSASVAGAYTCVCLGEEPAKEAFQDWLLLQNN